MPPSLFEKLHIKPGMTLALLHAPQSHAALFKDAPAGTKVITAARGTPDFILLFASSRADLEKEFPKALQLMGEDTPFWIAYPKLTGSIRSDLTRDRGWEAVAAAGLRPVSQIALDATWSALRFRRTVLVKSRATR